MIARIDGRYGWNQRTRFDTIFGVFQFALTYNKMDGRWMANVTNVANSATLYGIVMEPGRDFSVLRKIGFGGALLLDQSGELLEMNYLEV